MPRDGSGIYTQPIPDVVPATTIASTVYNGFVNDVETDLNQPRPIIAGGTGANSAQTARTNIKAEVSTAVVTNYDTQVWEAGSFSSASGATSAPVAGHAFSGISHMSDSNNIVVQARDQNDTTVPGRVYVREKKAGVWGAWTAQASFSVTDLDAAYVNVIGDTMTGNLTIAAAAPSLGLSKTASGQSTVLRGFTGTNGRWTLELGNATAESGSNNGSDFAINRYDDGGAYVQTPLSIARNNGLTTVTGDLLVNASSAPTQGFLKLGNTGSTYLAWDGTKFLFNGGPLSVTTVNASASVTTVTLAATSTVTAAGGFVTGTSQWTSDATNTDIQFNGATNFLRHVKSTGDYYFFSATAGSVRLQAGGHIVITGQGYKPGGGAWADSSDARVKNVLGDYAHGLTEILTLRPVRYTFKGNDTAHKAVADSGTEYVGLVAQECEAVFPELITLHPGEIDGKPVTDLRSLDPSALTFALINAVKQLSARIEALEATVVA